jgi:sugar phosphate isomerase/epimerase
MLFPKFPISKPARSADNGHMRLSICSFSFHRLLAAGKQDIFKYIADCSELGCTDLDPWNAHLAALKSGDEVIHLGHNPGSSEPLMDEPSGSSAADRDYLNRVKQAADEVGLPFGCIAVDGAHIYEADPEKRQANRARAYRWLDVAHRLGARQVRIDAGGPEDMPPEAFTVIKAGFEDLIARGKPLGLEILFENHWGPTKFPDNCVRLVEEIEGLGMLYDTHNFVPDLRDEGRRRCAKYAHAVHIKTLRWDEDGNETVSDIPRVIGYLKDAGYQGCWGIESVPADGDEYGGVKKTIALLERLAA